VGDDPADARVVERELRHAGYEPTIARVCTAEALGKTLAESTWDIILAADHGAGLSGLESLQVLRDIGRDVPMIVISGMAERMEGVAAVKTATHDSSWAGQLAPLSWAVKRELRAATLPGRHSQMDRELKRALADTQRARASAERAVQEREDFLATAAHELKTPVTVVRTLTQLIVRRLGTPQSLELVRLKADLEVLDQQANKLARLLATLLDVAGLDAGKLVLERKTVDIAQLVRAVVENYHLQSEHSRLRLESPRSVLAPVDPLRFEQVLRNLLDNAIKFSPPGSPIEVQVTMPDPQTVRVTVRDWGTGIPAERRGEIFERYKQGNPGAYRTGVGLGLYISRQIVESHGGRLDVDFPDDGGSRFYVTLPVIANVQAGSIPRPASRSLAASVP
jgi:signal transduction histidine kinase